MKGTFINNFNGIKDILGKIIDFFLQKAYYSYHSAKRLLNILLQESYHFLIPPETLLSNLTEIINFRAIRWTSSVPEAYCGVRGSTLLRGPAAGDPYVSKAGPAGAPYVSIAGA